jgi:hypothetical protein
MESAERCTLRGWRWLLKELIGEEREVALRRDRSVFLPQ